MIDIINIREIIWLGNQLLREPPFIDPRVIHKYKYTISQIQIWQGTAWVVFYWHQCQLYAAFVLDSTGTKTFTFKTMTKYWFSSGYCKSQIQQMKLDHCSLCSKRLQKFSGAVNNWCWPMFCNIWRFALWVSIKRESVRETRQARKHQARYHRVIQKCCWVILKKRIAATLI